MKRTFLSSCGVQAATLEVTYDNAHRLRFDPHTGMSNHLDEVGVEQLPEDMQQAMLSDMGFTSSQAKPPSSRWLSNHFRLVVWKLAATERAFPERLGGRYLLWRRVIQQLCHRRWREHDKGERSALRMVLNTDAPSSRLMILCVAKITFPPLTLQPSVTASGEAVAPSTNGSAPNAQTPPVRVELTDGWYCVDGVLDPSLSSLARQGRIQVGDKLAICNALLQGVSGGIDPLEVTRGNVDQEDNDASSAPFLCLFINSTRKARWDSKLGFQRRTMGMPVPISSLVAGGGNVSVLDAVVLRQYPIMYLERTKGSDGEELKKTLTEAEDAQAESDHEAVCQKMMEEMAEAVEKERNEQGKGRRPLVRRANAEDEWKQEHATRVRKMDEVRRRVESDPRFYRQSQPFLRAKVCWIKTTNSPDQSASKEVHPSLVYQTMSEIDDNTALITVWDMTEGFLEALQESNHVLLTSLTAPKPRQYPQTDTSGAKTPAATRGAFPPTLRRRGPSALRSSARLPCPPPSRDG